MSTVQPPSLFRHLWKAKLASGLIALALGVVVLVWPGPSILVAAVLFGLFLVLSGIIELVFALTLDVSVGNRILLLISGALSLILGVLAFRHFGQGYAVLLLAIWIGVAFIFQGVTELTLAISHREIPGRGWLVFGGILGESARQLRWVCYARGQRRKRPHEKGCVAEVLAFQADLGKFVKSR